MEIPQGDTTCDEADYHHDHDDDLRAEPLLSHPP
jgi:hypothetical protein